MTQDQLDEEIGNMSMIISIAVKMRGDKSFKQAIIKRASDYRQSLRDNPQLYLGN
jgi:hypothetical protein